jgi:hypothetical protein
MKRFPVNDAPRWRIVPYAVVDGVASLRPSFLRGLQERMRAEGLERWLMFGTTRPESLEELAVSRAVKFFSVVIDLDSKDLGEVASLFWLTDGTGEACLIHFCVFKKYWGKCAREMGRHVFATLFGMYDIDGRTLFPVIMGMTPSNNQPAVRYTRGVGMQMVGTVPNVFYDAHENRRVGAVITYMTAALLAEQVGEPPAGE